MPISPLQPGEAALDALATSHTRTVDALAGFEKMAEKAEPDFRPVVTRFIDLHRRHADQLARLLRRHGREPDADGSFMATVNRTVVAARALFDEVGPNVMNEIRRGEQNVLDALADAADEDLPADERAEVVHLQDELRRLLLDTSHLEPTRGE